MKESHGKEEGGGREESRKEERDGTVRRAEWNSTTTADK
jgi:hypothetical protein